MHYSLLPLLWLSTLTLTSGHPLTENPLEKKVLVSTKDGRALECTCLCGDMNSLDMSSFATCLRTPSQSTWTLAPSINSTLTAGSLRLSAASTEDPCQCLEQKCFCKPANIIQLQRRACQPKKEASTDKEGDRFEDAREDAFPTTEDRDTFQSATSRAFEANFKPVVVKKLNEIGGCISPTKCILPKGIEKVEMETLSMADEHWADLSSEEMDIVSKFDLETLMDILKTDPSFKVAEELGRGGFGVVHAAKDANGADFAVKFPNMRKKFGGIMSEVHQLQELSVLFEGQPESDLFLLPRRIFWLKADGKRAQLGIVMDRMDMDLYRFLDKGGITDFELMMATSKGLLEGLAALHEKRIVHNDIKPENILYNERSQDSPDIVRIADFGLSKPADEIRSVAGTPNYMSPEEVLSRVSAEPSDIWSAGMSLFEVATGRLPYEEFYSALKSKVDKLGYDMDSDPWWFTKVTYLAMFGKERLPILKSKAEKLVQAVDQLNLPLLPDYLRPYFRGQGQFANMLEEMLQLKPWDRPIAADLVQHPFFLGVRA